MVIPKELLEKWSGLRSTKDVGELAKKLPTVSKQSFYNAFNTGECADDVFRVMAEFYKEKDELVSAYVQN